MRRNIKELERLAGKTYVFHGIIECDTVGQGILNAAIMDVIWIENLETGEHYEGEENVKKFFEIRSSVK